MSVVVPTRNGAETIGAQLDALCRQEWKDGWEVIVADNGSTDGTRRMVDAYSDRLPDLRIVDASGVVGAARARNVAVGSSTGDAILFCDDDDEVGEGWLATMGQALVHHPFVAARVDPYKLNASWLAESLGSRQWNGLQRIPYPPYLPHAGGGTLGVWRSLFEAVGGFDENLLKVQDTFFCLRIQLSGAPLHFVPDAVVHVRYRATLLGMYHQARTYGEYSTLMYRKMRDLGTPPIPRPMQDGLAASWSLLRSLPAVRRKAGRAGWVFRLGYRIGRLRGSLKHRVLAP